MLSSSEFASMNKFEISIFIAVSLWKYIKTHGKFVLLCSSQHIPTILLILLICLGNPFYVDSTSEDFEQVIRM